MGGVASAGAAGFALRRPSNVRVPITATAAAAATPMPMPNEAQGELRGLDPSAAKLLELDGTFVDESCIDRETVTETWRVTMTAPKTSTQLPDDVYRHDPELVGVPVDMENVIKPRDFKSISLAWS